MATFTNPDSVHRASTGAIAPATWGDTVNDDINFLYGDTAWIGAAGVTFTNGWVDFGGASPMGFRKVGTRIVMRGAVKSGTVNTAAFTMPTGYRPLTGTNFAVVSNGLFGYLIISTAGVVTPVSGSNAYFALDGITFDTI